MIPPSPRRLIALGEALKPDFKAYQHQIVVNAKALSETLLDRGVKLVSGGTDNHLMLVDLKETEISGRQLEERLDSVRITANKNKIPGDPRPASETSGIRVGTPAVTARGFKEAEAKEVGELLAMAIQDFEAKKDEILQRVDALCQRFPLY